MRSSRRQLVSQNKKVRGRILLSIGVLMFIYITLSLLFGENGFIRYMKLQREKRDLVSEMHTIQMRNEDMDHLIKDTKNNPELIEESARDQGFIKEGEIVIKLEEGNPDK